MVCPITHCKRQRAQNAMVRRICHVRLFDHFTPFFSGLHWLLVRNKIQIETFLLTYKASKYSLLHLLLNCAPGYHLRSSNNKLLLLFPNIRILATFCGHSLTIAPKLCNFVTREHQTPPENLSIERDMWLP